LKLFVNLFADTSVYCSGHKLKIWMKYRALDVYIRAVWIVWVDLWLCSAANGFQHRMLT